VDIIEINIPSYFVLERSITDSIPGDDTSFETDVMPKLALVRSLAAFEREGFWQPMDTLRERNLLADLAIMSTPHWLLSKL
jgi:glucose-1-phosphate cytidylyltransferase